MSSFTGSIVLASLQVFNGVCDLYKSCHEYITRIYNGITSSLNNYDNMWLFISGVSFPIQYNNINNQGEHLIQWVFYNNENKLVNINSTKKYKLPWLSAKIVVHDNTDTSVKEYDIDDFISTFEIFSSENSYINKYNILYSWSIRNKIWLNEDNIIKFVIIDENADELELSMDDGSYFFTNNSKITLRFMNKTENDNNTNDCLLGNHENDDESEDSDSNTSRKESEDSEDSDIDNTKENNTSDTSVTSEASDKPVWIDTPELNPMIARQIESLDDTQNILDS